MNDFLNNNYYDGKPPKLPAQPGKKRKKHQVPERDKLFAAQKNLHKAAQLARDLEYKIQSLPPDHRMGLVGDMDKLEDHTTRAYKQVRTYLEDHTEAR